MKTTRKILEYVLSEMDEAIDVDGMTALIKAAIRVIDALPEYSAATALDAMFSRGEDDAE